MSDFRDATRVSAKPLVGLYAQSGAGKTMSALLLARGFVGEDGEIGMIETESGRGEAYADSTEYPELSGSGKSNYKVLGLRSDFSPRAFGDAITAAEKAKFQALIIDSASLEWIGPGGVLAMATENQERNLRGPIVWQKPKLEHQRHFMLRLMQTPIQLVILCMRARYPMEEKVKEGKKEWVRSPDLEPVQSDEILYEMFVHGWIDQQHKFHLTKSTAKALTPVFADNQPITLETGRKLAAWAAGSTPTPAPAPSARATPRSTPELKAEGLEAAEGGLGVITAWWGRLTHDQKLALQEFKDTELKPIAEAADRRFENEERTKNA